MERIERIIGLVIALALFSALVTFAVVMPTLIATGHTDLIVPRVLWGVWATIIIVVVALFLFVDRFICAITVTAQQRGVRKPNPELARIAAWLAAYFGTYRTASYRPDPLEEGHRIVEFLEKVDVRTAGFLREHAKFHRDSNQLPPILPSGEHAHQLMARHIGNVCRVLQQRKVLAT